MLQLVDIHTIGTSVRIDLSDADSKNTEEFMRAVEKPIKNEFTKRQRI